MTLFQRKNEYNKNNMSLCPINCNYINYSTEKKQVLCQCKIIGNSSYIVDKINKKEILLNNFNNIKPTSNLDIIKCYNELFSKKGLKYNLGNYILLSIIFILIIEIILFYNNDFNSINNNIKSALNYCNNSAQYNYSNQLEIMTSKDLINNIKEKRNKDINIFGEINYSDFELNSFNYIFALKYDKRNIWKYYLSLLKENHIIIFLFYNKNNYIYISKKIKIILLLFSFSLCYFINMLFFNEIKINKISERKNNIILIPDIIYAAIITHFIVMIIKTLLSKKKFIIELKTENNLENAERKIQKFTKIIKLKFSLFIILNFIVLIIFWYYIALFCALYKNTQFYLFLNTVLGYIFFLMNPFAIYLLSSIITRESIKNKGKLLFNFGKIIKYI